jgi:hypothetical protein
LSRYTGACQHPLDSHFTISNFSIAYSRTFKPNNDEMEKSSMKENTRGKSWKTIVIGGISKCAPYSVWLLRGVVGKANTGKHSWYFEKPFRSLGILVIIWDTYSGSDYRHSYSDYRHSYSDYLITWGFLKDKRVN